MTIPASDLPNSGEDAPQIHVVLATHRREVQAALFHSINAMSMVTIAATGTSTAEMVNYSRAFRPDFVIVETGLPGVPLGEVFIEMEATDPRLRILLIGEDAELRTYLNPPRVEIFTDVEVLIARLPDEGDDTS